MLWWITCSITKLIYIIMKYQKHKWYCLWQYPLNGSYAGTIMRYEPRHMYPQKNWHFFLGFQTLLVEFRERRIKKKSTTTDTWSPVNNYIPILSKLKLIFHSELNDTILPTSRSDIKSLGYKKYEDIPYSHVISISNKKSNGNDKRSTNNMVLQWFYIEFFISWSNMCKKTYWINW